MARRRSRHRKSPSRKQSRSHLQGWITRRRQEAERVAKALKAKRRKAGLKAARTRRRHDAERAEKEAQRLKKWRASYRKYLKFRIPKQERERLETPEAAITHCVYLYNGEEDGTEQFWGNIRSVIGNSIGNQLARIPAEVGDVTVWFRIILQEELDDPDEDPDNMGTIVVERYTSSLDLEDFWSEYFEHARGHWPHDANNNSAGSLLVIKIQVCYCPGEVLA